LKSFKKLRTASLNSEFTGSYKKVYITQNAIMPARSISYRTWSFCLCLCSWELQYLYMN